ncbi:hypothetical protein EIP86_011118 [Pleurotus ostreatoroseus]|nr:hypothetical protein EIP86_011118 [Pleurotus ostreatoroseus]
MPMRLLQYAVAVLLTFAHFHSISTVFILSASPVAAQVGPPTNATNLPTDANRVRAAMAIPASAASATRSARKCQKEAIAPLTVTRSPSVGLAQPLDRTSVH